jgi:hypothetical protein
MRRREFMMLAGGAVPAGLFTTALRATAQTAKMPRVGILSPASSEAARAGRRGDRITKKFATVHESANGT